MVGADPTIMAPLLDRVRNILGFDRQPAAPQPTWRDYIGNNMPQADLPYRDSAAKLAANPPAGNLEVVDSFAVERVNMLYDRDKIAAWARVSMPVQTVFRFIEGEVLRPGLSVRSEWEAKCKACGQEYHSRIVSYKDMGACEKCGGGTYVARPEGRGAVGGRAPAPVQHQQGNAVIHDGPNTPISHGVR